MNAVFFFNENRINVGKAQSLLVAVFPTRLFQFMEMIISKIC